MGQVVSMLARPVYGYAEIDRLLRLTPGTAKRWILTWLALNQAS